MWVSHDAYKWVMSRVSESCHTWMSHVTCEWVHTAWQTFRDVQPNGWDTCEWVMTHIDEWCHVRVGRGTGEWVMSHIWMSHVTDMNESCHTYEWVMSHIWTSHVTHEWVMSQIWTSRVTHMNESCHMRVGSQCLKDFEGACGWVMTHINESPKKMSQKIWLYLIVKPPSEGRGVLPPRKPATLGGQNNEGSLAIKMSLDNKLWSAYS